MKNSRTRLRRLASMADVSAADWNRLAGTDNPFLRHEYLYALEASGSATPATGWTPKHLAVEDEQGRVIGAVPLWLKRHSFGELVYDFAWAQAYERAGFPYYPKLVACVPFSPITGPRLLLAADALRDGVVETLLNGARELAEETRASSLHWLFTDANDTAMLEARGYLHRTGFQFHWQNNGYTDFEQFLAGFTAQKRKKLKRERRYVQEAGVATEIRTGAQMTPELWDSFHTLYTDNILRHGGMIHLTREFFHILGRTLPEAVVMVLAKKGHNYVGAAINLRDREALYGRYWGGQEGIHSLHFETCYYAPIEYCIAHGLKRFEGGAGGEHKLARGFLPVATHSLHWLRHPQFARAVADFLARERNGVEYYIDELNEHAPFKRSVMHDMELAADDDHPTNG
jgi:predicted N-acyltransferase